MIRRLVESVEAKTEADGFGVAPWSSEQLEIVLREQKTFEREAAVLERYAEVAHAKLEKSQSI